MRWESCSHGEEEEEEEELAVNKDEEAMKMTRVARRNTLSGLAEGHGVVWGRPQD